MGILRRVLSKLEARLKLFFSVEADRLSGGRAIDVQSIMSEVEAYRNP